MKLRRDMIWPIIALLLLGAGAWWWFATMKQVSQAIPHESEAATKDPLLAAKRWLRHNGWAVQSADTLDVALPQLAHSKTLLVLERDGFITAATGNALLDWVDEGGLLILPARKLPPAQRKPGDLDGRDAIEDLLQTGLNYGNKTERKARYPVQLPGGSRPLLIDSPLPPLSTEADGPSPDWQDEGGNIMLFSHGEGRIVLLNYGLRFDNHQLRELDHAEFLLQLLRLQSEQGAVMLVQGLSMPPWYLALWHYFSHSLIALALLIIAVLWWAIPRFGPLLPEPTTERRALLEHIDASGRWLWRSASGRERLLLAMRAAALAQMQRRAPGLLRLERPALLHRLSRQTSLAESTLANALHGQASPQAAEFTQQIRTLQTLRQHHD